MRAHGYPQSFATGVIAAGGSLGIMIPPSTVFAVYGLITEQDIGKLFIAGIVPGMLAIGMYIATINLIAFLCPNYLPADAAAFLGGTASKRCAASGRWCCCSCSSSAACTADCSPPPKPPAWARAAPSSSR